MHEADQKLTGDWVEFPGLVTEHELRQLASWFEQAGIAFRSHLVTMGGDPYAGGSDSYDLYLPVDQVRRAARTLAQVLEIVDPEGDAPRSEDCPACGQRLGDAACCPSCGINLGSHLEPDDPRVVFLRVHGGFLDPDCACLAALEADGSDMSRPMRISFWFGVESKEAGEAVADAVGPAGFDTAVEQEDDGSWRCYCLTSMVAALDAIHRTEEELTALAASHGGRLLGWGSDGNADLPPYA